MTHLAQSTEPLNVLTAEELANKLQVLVVDDSKLQRRIVSLSLKKWGFNVIEAASGEEALEICKNQSVDLVLSDWMMPGMDGLEFCKQFRKLDRDRYGYFILLTSKNEKNDVAIGLDIGADDFLSKPVNSAELKARIRAGTRVLDMEQKLISQNDAVASALEELQNLYEEINKDLVEAENLQQSLIPTRQKTYPYGEISILFQSSGHVGGDLVGFFSFSDKRLGIYSIDVSGHGISSALLTARLAGYFSAYNKEQNVAFERLSDGEYQHRSPADVAAALNQRMIEEIETEHYFTLAYADIDVETGISQIVQAGHPHPVVFNPNTGVKLLGEGGPPIGLLPDVPFETFSVQLEPGDKLMLYSDGITECQTPAGDLLDDDGFIDLLRKHIHGGGPEFMNDILWELTSFANERPFDDDISGILFEFNKP